MARVSKLKRLDIIIADMEVKLGRNCDPVVTLLELSAGHNEVGRIRADWLVKQGLLDLATNEGKKQAAELIDVPLSIRIDAAKSASRFVRAVLAQTEVSGPGGGPITTASATLPIEDLMSKEDATRFLEDVAIAAAERRRTQHNTEEETADGDPLYERADTDGAGEDGR